MIDPRRTAVVQAALSQVGPGDVPAYWASSGLPPDTHKAWCGAFTLWCLHQALLILDVKWIPGIGYAGPQHLAITRSPQPGDIFYKDQPSQHYGVVESFNPVTGVLTSIEGNTPTVQRLVHPHPTGVVYYSIDKFLGMPPADPSVHPWENLLRGIDVSHHQNASAVDYGRLAETHRFVIARATYGTKPDEMFSEHVYRARQAGLVCGAYHFFRPSQSVVDQFDAFLSAVGVVGYGQGWLPPAVDVEQDPGSLATTDTYAPAEHLTALLHERFGAAMVYVAVGFWSEIGHPEWVREHLLWTAHWDVQHPTTPFGMPWTVWQHHVGVMPGVAPGQLDHDVAPSLPLLRAHDPAEPLLLAVDWDELRADRDAEVQEKDT